MSIKLIPTENNPNPMPFTIKSEPLESDIIRIQVDNSTTQETSRKRKRINSSNDDLIERDLTTTKLEQKIEQLTSDLLNEKAKNQRQASELLAFKLKIERQNNIEKELIGANKAFKLENEQLKKRLSTFDSLSNDLMKIQQGFKTLNQQDSNKATNGTVNIL